MTGAFTMVRHVEYYETDMAGIVHFSEFFRYMESAEHALFRSLGMSVTMEHEGRHVAWPRVSCSFEFRQPLRFEDEIEIRIAVEKLGGRSATFRADIVKDGTLAATGRSTSVCCHMKGEAGMESITIPDEIRRKLESALIPDPPGA